jgi:uncharacterized lipoprotein YddW (UPF0748 family)
MVRNIYSKFAILRLLATGLAIPGVVGCEARQNDESVLAERKKIALVNDLKTSNNRHGNKTSFATRKSSSSTSKKTIAIYSSRYAITNNADEKTVRDRVRYYHSKGVNTIIQGVWGNGCTMYKSEVTKNLLGQVSCPNVFQENWLDWMIDEAKKNGMQVHGYFEKGIKIDKNSPVYNLAIERNWLVPGVDKTYQKIDHYVLNVENPEVIELFHGVLAEFVQKYPSIDAVQFDDYLGYTTKLPGGIDRTAKLTKFTTGLVSAMKRANPSVSFDVCHLNPYWSKRYLAADWKNWKADRTFVQAYDETNFKAELTYAENTSGIAITDRQLQRVPGLLKNPRIKNILVFPFTGDPQMAANKLGNVKNN